MRPSARCRPLGLRHLPDETASAAIARIAYQRVAHRPPPDELKPVLSWAVHAGYGLLVAALYGALRTPGRQRRHSTRRAVALGAVLGVGLWLVSDELAMPLLGFADKPIAYHPSCAESQPAGTRGISERCRCSLHAHLDRRPSYHGAAMGTEAVRFLVLWMAGWVNSRQFEVIEFLQEENRVLREQLSGRLRGAGPGVLPS